MNKDICISLLCCIISLIKFYGINLALFSADDYNNNFWTNKRKVDSKHNQKALKFFKSQKIQISCETQLFVSKFFQGALMFKYGSNILLSEVKGKILVHFILSSL